MKRALSLFLFSSFFVTDLLACPYCAGNTQGGKDSNTTLVLAGFILLIYIPFFIIYRMVKKQRALSEAHDNTGSSYP